MSRKSLGNNFLKTLGKELSKASKVMEEKRTSDDYDYMTNEERDREGLRLMHMMPERLKKKFIKEELEKNKNVT